MGDRTSKVFLFDEDIWLYCNSVSFKDGIWRGWVMNGAWHLVYNTLDKSLKAYKGSDERGKPVTEYTANLTWMCDRGQDTGDGWDYNRVIAEAKQRYLDDIQ